MEEAELASRAHHFFNEEGPPARVVAKEVNARDRMSQNGPGLGGLEVGEDLGWVDEEVRDGGEAGVNETFDFERGFFELLNLLGSVEGLLSGVGEARHGSIQSSGSTDVTIGQGREREGRRGDVRGREEAPPRFIG